MIWVGIGIGIALIAFVAGYATGQHLLAQALRPEILELRERLRHERARTHDLAWSLRESAVDRTTQLMVWNTLREKESDLDL